MLTASVSKETRMKRRWSVAMVIVVATLARFVLAADSTDDLSSDEFDLPLQLMRMTDDQPRR